MSEDLLKGFDPSSPGLVPVLRAVRGPNGVFVRKYHVDIEKVKKMIQEAELNTLPYLTRIPGHKLLRKFLSSKNVKELTQSLFSKSPRSIPVIYNRYTRSDILETYRHKRQRLFQNLYAYYLTKNKIVEVTLKTYIQPSLKYNQDVYESIPPKKVIEPVMERVIKPKVPTNNSRVRPWNIKKSPFALNIKKTIQFQNPTTYPRIFNEQDSLEKESFQKEPVQEEYKLKTIRKEDHPGFAGELSRFFNYLHPNVRKTILMVSKTLLFGGLQDKDYLLNNLTLLPDMIYPSKSDYWSIIISRALLNTGSLFNQSESCDNEKRFYQYLVLQNIDSETFDSVCQMCPPPIEIENDLSNWEDLTVNQRMYLLAGRANYSSREKHILRNTADLDEFIRYLSALAPVMSETEAFDFIDSEYPDLLSIEYLFRNIKKVQIDKESPNFLYFLIQLFGSKLLHQHYLPYNRIGDTRHGPFSSYMCLKLRKNIDSYIKNALINRLSTRQSGYGKLNNVEVILPIPDVTPKDKQLFIRAEPFTSLYLKDAVINDISGIPLTVSSDSIVYASEDETFVIVGDLIKAIT